MVRGAVRRGVDVQGYRPGMSFTLSRLTSAGTAAYSVFALAKPDHLASALQVEGPRRSKVDLMAYTYAARDLPISLLAMRSSSPRVVTAAMLLRIVTDLSDATILGSSAKDPQVRQKVLTVTLGWAAANGPALLIDRRRHARTPAAVLDRVP